MDAFRARVVDAMGNNSRSMEMDIVDVQPGSAVEIAASLLNQPATFINDSQRLPIKLANAQVAKNLPGGVVVVFSGTVGAMSSPYVGVIKAETQSGFQRQADAVNFFSDLFLTPAIKLYKIGMFVREGAAGLTLPEGWRAHVYDSEMSIGNREGAARYFFGTFLGCEIPVNSAALTKAFFEHTKDFIASMPVTPEKKNDLLTSLYTYLKVDTTPTITVNDFSTTFIPVDARDGYQKFMSDKKVPLTAIQKDIAALGTSLRLRKVGFRNNIKLTAPPEVFKEMFEIKTIPHDGAKPGQPSHWTIITIKDQISEQE
jgi:hypothetical protein